MKKVRWGVLSTARIGTRKVIPAMQRCRFAEVRAIASRSEPAAQAAADELGLPRAYGSYEALLDDPEIDAVYNPLPNHLHLPWTLRALEAGKHVLCEKPIGLSVAEAETIRDAGRRFPRLKLMEAFMYRHHPQWQQALHWVRQGAIGELRTIQTVFSYYNDNPDDIRNIAKFGGGALMDIGCYPISLSRFLFESEPLRVQAYVEYDPRFEVDRLTAATLEFEGGTSTFTCSTQMAPAQRVQIFGTQGRIELEIPFNAPPDRPCMLWLQRGEEVEQHHVETCDQYTLQGDLMSQAILNDEPVPTPIDDAVANMRVIEAVFAAGRNGDWVPPAQSVDSLAATR